MNGPFVIQIEIQLSRSKPMKNFNEEEKKKANMKDNMNAMEKGFGTHRD